MKIMRKDLKIGKSTTSDWISSLYDDEIYILIRFFEDYFDNAAECDMVAKEDATTTLEILSDMETRTEPLKFEDVFQMLKAEDEYRQKEGIHKER